MAADVIRPTPFHKEVSEGAKEGDFHEDREIGPDAVDIERIEKVYKYV